MHILLITRHYPPEISGGARRPSLYVKALRELGHQVTLVTPFKLDDPDSITVKSEAIQKGIQEHHTGSFSKSRNRKPIFGNISFLSSVKDSLRIWLYWPDDNISWVIDTIRTVKQQNFEPDWIMTTSPPESIHVAGYKLSKYFNIPWIAELRDTWVEAPHRRILAQSKFRAYIEKRIARKVLKSAKAVTAVSETVMSEARNYINKNTPEIIIPHFSDPPPKPYKFDNNKINLVHTGGFTLSDRRRQLAPLLEVLEKAFYKRPNIIFHIAGPLTFKEKELIQQARIPIITHGPVSLINARALQAGADGLILYTPKNSHALPGKYAEYRQAGRPILYLGNGPWMSLVGSSENLIPLWPGILQLKKNEIIPILSNLSHTQAAEKLINFLKKV